MSEYDNPNSLQRSKAAGPTQSSEALAVTGLEKADHRPQRIVIILTPEFSMMAFTAFIEPLRAANRVSAQRLYRWRVVTLDGYPVTASNGLAVQPDEAFSPPTKNDWVVVCAGMNAQSHASPKLLASLRKAARVGAQLGSVCTGSEILARAGLLQGYRCTVHWEEIDSFAETFPDLDITSSLFEIDRDRFTCSGGTAPLDMMINAIANEHGRDLAMQVSELMLHNSVREPATAQRFSIQERLGASHPKLLSAISSMEANLETPLSLKEVASLVGCSIRQLERVFSTSLNTTPGRYYLTLRLEKARRLIVQTAMPILDIAFATGFSSAAHFSKTYRDVFHRTPSEERRRAAPYTDGDDDADNSDE